MEKYEMGALLPATTAELINRRFSTTPPPCDPPKWLRERWAAANEKPQPTPEEIAANEKPQPTPEEIIAEAKAWMDVRWPLRDGAHRTTEECAQITGALSMIAHMRSWLSRWLPPK
jgi:hypothetical protein